MKKLVYSRDSNWSSDLKSNKDFVSLMEEKGLTVTEIHIGVDIYNYIDSQGEIGARAADLLERYEDKIFLQKVLDYLNELKLVMKTGVCEVTYVHWKHIKPWVVNTYHLKRYDRVSQRNMFTLILFLCANCVSSFFFICHE